jgi:hypothetical protein
MLVAVEAPVINDAQVGRSSQHFGDVDKQDILHLINLRINVLS